jgi:hypothetical protein
MELNGHNVQMKYGKSIDTYFKFVRYQKFNIHIHIYIYRVSQEERTIFWEVIVSVILSKKRYMNMCVLFRTVSEIEPF